MSERRSILYVSRPFLGSNEGTGEQVVARETVKALSASRKSQTVSYVPKLWIKPYHGILSLILYDWFCSSLYSVKNLIAPYDLVVFNSPYQGLFSLIFTMRSSTVCIVNDMFFHDNTRKSCFDVYSHYTYKVSLRFCNKIVTTSEETAHKIKTVYGFESVVSRLGVNIQANQGRSKHTKVVRVGYIGSYVSRKRPECLLELAALSGVQKFEFLFAGIIPEHIQNQLMGMNEKNIKIIGELTDRQKSDFFLNIDYLYFPTSLEGYGLPLLEAMAYNTIPIVHQDAQIPNFIKEHCIKVLDSREAARFITSHRREESTITDRIYANHDFAHQLTWNNFIKHIL